MKFKEGDRVCVEGDVITQDGRAVLVEFGDSSRIWLSTISSNIYYAPGEREVKNV